MYNQESQGFYEDYSPQETPYYPPVSTNQIHRNTLWILGLLVLMMILGYLFYQKSQENHSETMFSMQDIMDGLPKIKKFERG